jgi:type 1 glutamine amidotransferase
MVGPFDILSDIALMSSAYKGLLAHESWFAMKSVIRLLVVAAACMTAFAAPPVKVLIIDGQNNHDWQATTPVLKKLLEETRLFQVDVLTSPLKGADMSGFKPEFSKYRVVVSNYNGDSWTPEVQTAFEKFVTDGGGFVSYHAADNSFPEWSAYNEMIGIGGWGDREQAAGPFWYFRDGKMVSDDAPGKAGNHGARKPFQVTIRDPAHPIVKGLPPVWMHDADELYSKLRGPGEKMTLLATAYSDPENRGSGHDEPMLMALRYGNGRIFHTTLGHDVPAMSCVGFIVTLQRGTEWAATGKVTQRVPADFPTADKVSIRPLH